MSPHRGPQDAYDISQLRHPTELAALRVTPGRPPLRRDAPFGRVRPPPPRVLPTSAADIADFIADVGDRHVGPGAHALPSAPPSSLRACVCASIAAPPARSARSGRAPGQRLSAG